MTLYHSGMTNEDVMLVCPACRTVLRTPDVDPTLSRCPKCGGGVLDKWSADGKRPLGPVHVARPSKPRGWVVEEGVTLVVRHRSLLYRRQIELGQGRLRVLIRGLSPAAAFWLKDLLEVRLGISVIEPHRVDL